MMNQNEYFDAQGGHLISIPLKGLCAQIGEFILHRPHRLGVDNPLVIIMVHGWVMELI